MLSTYVESDGTRIPFVERTVAGVSVGLRVPQVSASGSMRLDLLSCASAISCMAIGRYLPADTTQPEQVVQARYDGVRWTSEILPNPADDPNQAQATFSLLTCPTETFCAAQGEGFLATWSDQNNAWTYFPDGGSDGYESEEIRDISCASATLCAAVGMLPNDGGGSRFTYLPLVLTWNGATWTQQTAPMPDAAVPGDTEYAGELDAVSCVLVVCHAVGMSGSESVTPPTETPIAVTLSALGTLTSTAMPGMTHDALAPAAPISITCPTPDWCAVLRLPFPTDGLVSVAYLSGGTWTAGTVPEIVEGQLDQTQISAHDQRLQCSAPGFCVLFGVINQGDFGSGAYQDWLDDGTWTPYFTAVPDDAATSPNVQPAVQDDCSIEPACEETFQYFNDNGEYENAIVSSPDLDVTSSAVDVAAIRHGRVSISVQGDGHHAGWRHLGGPKATAVMTITSPATSREPAHPLFLALGSKHRLRYRSTSGGWRTANSRVPCRSAPTASATGPAVVIACTNAQRQLVLGLTSVSGSRLTRLSWVAVAGRRFRGRVVSIGAGQTLHVFAISASHRLLELRPREGVTVIAKNCASDVTASLLASRNVGYVACRRSSGKVTEWVNRNGHWEHFATVAASALQSLTIAATPAGPALVATLVNNSVAVRLGTKWRTVKGRVTGPASAVGVD